MARSDFSSEDFRFQTIEYDVDYNIKFIFLDQFELSS